MILQVHPENPEKRYVQQILDGIRDGRIFILPTDTVYAFVCDLDAPRAINELYRLKNLSEKHPLSLLCRDVAMASHYARSIPQAVFRFMKSHTPGPYTFILNANRMMDRRGMGRKKEVGIRIVDHPLHRALMEQLDTPLVSTSITMEAEFTTDPEDLERLYGHDVAAVVDGGIRAHEYSTILDCRPDPLILMREGIGTVDDLEFVRQE